MISVQEADKIISASMPSFGMHLCPLNECAGTVLREDLVADRDLPPSDKALMDGIAISTDAFLKGARAFRVCGTQSAGKDALKLEHPDQCLEIMTGAMLPKGSDCVIPIESVSIENEMAVVRNGSVEHMQHVRPQGADHKKGDVLVTKNTVLSPVHLAVAASIGRSDLNVSVKPRVAVISTGDEIVEVEEEAKPFETRKSNSIFIQTALARTNLFKVDVFHFRDDKKLLLDEIGKLLTGHDVLIFTGGVSMGKFDYVPQVLDELNVTVKFHKVRQKPGKPFLFGSSIDGRPVFALPGNPVSTEVGTYRYVLPHLKTALGVDLQPEYASLSDDFKVNTDFVFFLMVKLRTEKNANWLAQPVPTGGSGDFAGVAHSDGFMELPEKQNIAKAGFCGRVYRWN